jgi:PEP-CTERM motif
LNNKSTEGSPMKFVSSSIRALAAAGVFATASVAHAAPILYVGDSGGTLGTVDVATGSATVIGSMGVVMTDIAFDGTGDLWAISFNNLYRVNKTTGAGTLVGSLGVNDANALTFGSDGTLYAAGLSNSFYTVNTATGAASLVGNTGVASSGDLAFRNGTLYLTAGSTGNDSLFSINTANGAGTLIGSLGVPDMFGLATPDNNVVYGTSGQSVFAVDTSTGAASFLVNWGNGLGGANGAAFLTEAAPVPEPSTYALMLAGLGLLGFRFFDASCAGSASIPACVRARRRRGTVFRRAPRVSRGLAVLDRIDTTFCTTVKCRQIAPPQCTDKEKPRFSGNRSPFGV